MKKGLIIALIITISLAIVSALAISLYQNDTANIKQNEDRKLAEDINDIDKNRIELVTTSLSEVKISPNASIIYETKYRQCGHTIKKQMTVTEDLINLNEEELKKRYNEYEIKQFSAGEIHLYKEEDGICDEHYVLREYNGYIAIYNLESDGKENLKEITNIVTNYLPDIDIERLNIGIRVNGKQELNAAIEDYE